MSGPGGAGGRRDGGFTDRHAWHLMGSLMAQIAQRLGRCLISALAAVSLVGVLPASSQTKDDVDKAWRTKNYNDLLKWASQGHAYAQHNLADLYSHDKSAPNSLAEAAKWYALAASGGDAGAQYSLGRAYEEGLGVRQDPLESVRWYTLSARQGYELAQSQLAYAYQHGIGVNQDLSEAFRWYSEASKGGDADAAMEVGLALYEGRGVIQDYYKGAERLEHAAKCGLSQAQYHLGNAYSTGQGVRKDLAQAYMWLNVAASTPAGALVPAAERRDLLAAQMTAEQVAEAQRMSRKFNAFPYYSKHCVKRSG